jgi:hypothetical protein
VPPAYLPTAGNTSGTPESTTPAAAPDMSGTAAGTPESVSAVRLRLRAPETSAAADQTAGNDQSRTSRDAGPYRAADGAEDREAGRDARPARPSDPTAGTANESRTTGPVAPTGAGAPQDPASAPAPHGAGKPEDVFADLYDQNVVPIVLTLGPRASAVGYLHSIAQLKLPDEKLRSAFVSYGVDRLSRLTLGEALRRGLLANQYELWRRSFFGETNPPAVHPLPALPEFPPAGTGESNAPATAGSGGVTPGSDRVVSSAVPANLRPPADGSLAGSKTALSNAQRSEDQRVPYSGVTVGATATEQSHYAGTPSDLTPSAPAGDSGKAAIGSVVTLIIKPVTDMVSEAVRRLLPASVMSPVR